MLIEYIDCVNLKQNKLPPYNDGGGGVLAWVVSAHEYKFNVELSNDVECG